MDNTSNLWPQPGDKPHGHIINRDVVAVVLDLDHAYGDHALIGDLSHDFAGYLDLLSAEAANLADAIRAQINKTVEAEEAAASAPLTVDLVYAEDGTRALADSGASDDGGTATLPATPVRPVVATPRPVSPSSPHTSNGGQH